MTRRIALYLYRISQTENVGYGCYTDAVVCAASGDEARMMDPAGPDAWAPIFQADQNGYVERTDWATAPERVTVQLLGTAAPGLTPGVICASNRGG